MIRETDLKNVRIAYHRNGVGGLGFHALAFDWRDGTGKLRHMAAVRLDASDDRTLRAVCCFVLDAGMAVDGNVAFGENSWRGDDFARAIDAHLAARNQQEAGEA